MTTTEFTSLDIGQRPRSGPLAFIGGLFARWKQRRRERATVIELSRMDAHLLRDMGIEPSDVLDALNHRRSSILFDPLRRRTEDHE